MSGDSRLDRRIRWTNYGAFALLALILAIAAWTLATVSIGRGEEKGALEAQTQVLRKQNKLLRDQNESLGALVERQRRVDASSAERLQGAIDDVEELVAAQFAEHDLNVATKLNDLLAQIAALLERPAPGPVFVGPRSGAPTVTAAPQRTVTPTTTAPPRPATTTTTAPAHQRCVANPDHPRC